MSNESAASGTVKPPSVDHPENATVTHWEDLNEELAICRITPDAGQVEPFEPGQFATIGMARKSLPISPDENYPPDDPRWKKLWRRAYSIASSPKHRDYLELYVVLVNDGKLTPKLWHAKKGGRIWLDPHIKGEFTLHGVPDGKDLVMVATGTGLAPYLSMMHNYRATGRWRRLVLIHGVRLHQDLGYGEELRKIAKEDPSIIYVPACTREPVESAWQGIRGRVTQLFESDNLQKSTGVALKADESHVFLCGNPDMINQVEALLLGRGFVTQTKKLPGNIHLERYW